jgi:tetratricopeptide (TPR) repeat protein
MRVELLQGFPVVRARSPMLGNVDTVPHLAMRHALLGLVELRLGNATAAANQLAAIHALPADAIDARQTAAALHASILVADGRQQTALDGIEQFRRQNDHRGQYWGFSMFNNGLERYLRAELLLYERREQEAFAWYDSMNQDIMFNYFFFAPAHLRRAEILDGQGRREDAARHYSKFLALWRNADAESQPDVRRAQQRLQGR